MLLRDQDNATVLGKVLEVLGVQGGERQSVCQAVRHDPGVIDGPGSPPRGSGGRQFLRGDARYGPAESEALTLDFVADAQLAERFRLALDMYEFGEKMTQSRLRRHHPGATDEQIARMLRDWRMERPGASGGDAAGRPSRQFR